MGRTSEKVATRIDRAVDDVTAEARAAAQGYNPVRIAGNTAAMMVRGAFSVLGAIAVGVTAFVRVAGMAKAPIPSGQDLARA